MEKRVRYQILAGGMIWLALLFSPIEGGLQRQLAWVVFLAIWVIFPLGLSLTHPSSFPSIPYRVALFLHPFAACIVTVAYFFPHGILAGTFAIAWFPLTLFAAWNGIVRLQEKGWRVVLEHPSEICFVAGPLYLPVGAFWLLMARLGAEPLGFSEPIVTLTAIHFHYAGFAAPVLCGLVGRAMSKPAMLKIVWIIAGVVVLGPALVAIGITFSPLVEAMVGAILALGYTGLALITLGQLKMVQSRLSRMFLGISSLAAMITMIAAAGFALRTFNLFPFLSIPQMVVIHGWGNALGFVLCGLIGWRLNQKSAMR